jgi:hypothetical protein
MHSSIFRFILIVAFLFLPIKGQAQDNAFFTWKRLTLCESFQSKAEQAQAAFISYSAPKGQKQLYSWSTALGYDVAWNAVSQYLELNVIGEYKRDNQIKKEQHIFLAGMAADWTMLDMVEKKWSPLAIGKVNLKNDFVDSLKSLQANLLFSVLFVGHKQDPAYFWIPGIVSNFGFIKTRYTLYGGGEYEHVLDTKVTKGIKSDIYRGFARINFRLLPLPRLLHENLELSADCAYRHDLSNNIDALNNDYTLLEASADVILYKSDNGKHTASVSLDYSKGDDPSNAIKDRNIVKIIFKLKL